MHDLGLAGGRLDRHAGIARREGAVNGLEKVLDISGMAAAEDLDRLFVRQVPAEPFAQLRLGLESFGYLLRAENAADIAVADKAEHVFDGQSVFIVAPANGVRILFD